jgi:transcriptional regulator
MTTAELFVPEAYRAENAAAIVEKYPFALLVTTNEAGIWATSTPVIFEGPDRGTLVGHLARRNAHASALKTGDRALAVFQGPHAYISPRWYLEKPEVPTWDYVTAQVRGTIETIDDPEDLRAILAATAAHLEHGEEAWTLDSAPAGRVDMLLPLIRGFRMAISSISGASKLSQGHPESDRLRIADELRKTQDCSEIAALITGTIGR